MLERHLERFKFRNELDGGEKERIKDRQKRGLMIVRTGSDDGDEDDGSWRSLAAILSPRKNK